jgi:methionyl-tRNA formyltransferase
MDQVKVLLCGFHWVGCRVLEHLVTRPDVSDVAVLTHPCPPHIESVGQLAAANGLWNSEVTVNDRTHWPFKPDIIASVYYRDIIRRNVIDEADGRVFNLHPSLLPRHRGCSSLTWAIAEGDAVAGITYHYIDQGVDTGAILLQAAMQISPSDTQATLFERAMGVGSEFWPAAFELVKCGFPGVPQIGKPTRHRRGPPFGGQIDSSWPLSRVERFIRAMTNPPYPYASYKGHEICSLKQYARLRAEEVASL